MHTMCRLAGDNTVYLLDWDRGDRRVPASWCNSNLARLHHSLNKLSTGGMLPLQDWQRVINSYMDTWQASSDKPLICRDLDSHPDVL